jgi:hypothetical protein
MGGDLVAESRPGAGSAFTLWLPAPAAVRAYVARVGGAEGAGSGARTGAARPALERRRRAPLAAPSQLLSAGAVSDVVQAVTDRLRADPAAEMARERSQAQLEGHWEALLAEVARAVAIYGDGQRDGESSHGTGADAALRPGGESELQQLIAERHGAQRRRLGWTEAALGREYQILREEVERAVRQNAPRGTEHLLDRALAIIRRLLKRAEATSRQGYRTASAVDRSQLEWSGRSLAPGHTTTEEAQRA